MPQDQLQQPEVATLTTQIIATGLGLIGGMMPVLYGQDSMTAAQRAGCVIAGGATAFSMSPLIAVAWPGAPTGVVCAAGYFFGMAGIFIARGLMAWLRRAELKIPDQIDRRTGIDTKRPPDPPDPPDPADKGGK